MHIAIYARVSTTRQAENDLSIPDQLRQVRAWAERLGHVVVKEYIEPGASATDDKRPVFQDMMTDATLKGASPFQAIVVHSFSRFFRDHIEAAIYQRRLRKHGVRVESITQQTNDDPSGEMHRSMIMLFDEYQSKETAKHVLRGMQENARQGYFNGARPPYGYQTIDAGQTGIRGRFKKKLEVLESEAALVREIFTLYIHGKDSPRIGSKEIAKQFNARGIPMRGGVWGSQRVLTILSNPAYAGNYRFNRIDSKTGRTKDAGEWISIPVPAIIDQEQFDQAARLREANAPTACAPRRETSPTLLTGLVRCGTCGAGMVMATGKSGKYRYYKCTARLKRGNAACASGNIPMDKLDNLVLESFKQTVFTSEHIRSVIDELRRETAKRGNRDEKQHVKTLETKLLESEQALNRLYEGVEKGVMELDEHLKLRLQQHKQAREAMMVEIAGLKRQTQSPLAVITPQKIDAVARILNKRLSEATPFAKAYLKAALSEIRVTDGFVSLNGANTAMATLVAANGAIPEQNQVPRFTPEWWAVRGSNPRHPRCK
jgi:DNA invertase Pin-like site-specific DNA recombinase